MVVLPCGARESRRSCDVRILGGFALRSQAVGRSYGFIAGGPLATSGNRVAAIRLPEIGIHVRLSHRAAIDGGENHDDSLLQHRAEPPPGNRLDADPDFNNYPAYIEGVSESVIEDDRGG